MAVLLAPYNNSMRLGQGFNSYTQQICLNDAVMRPSKVHPEAIVGKQREATIKNANPAPGQTGVADDVGSVGDTQISTTKDTTLESSKPLTDGAGGGVSQIVSYSSRFVDKLSDVVDAMNISASLSIKTATIGGAASGSFIDSDKFKESDMNFFVQVKVVNQVIFGEDYTDFQNVLPPGARFTEVYGDTYISGFEQGGELNALISVKVSDKSKTFAIKAELEATLGTPALSSAVKGGVDLNKSEMKSSTETTVTVNWSGGGQIKPTDAIWDVNTLTLAAANFPDLVAKTPQRTYAILSKYTSLKSFLKIYQPSSVLTYENVGVYTSALLDMYMDYKSIWKQIQLANFELKNRRADIRIAKPSTEMMTLAKERQKVVAEKTKSAENTVDQTPGIATPTPSQLTGTQNASNAQVPIAGSGTSTANTQVSTANTQQADATSQISITQGDPKSVIKVPDLIDFEPYPATVLGMDRARRECRNEMIKIVSEVDLVTTHPELALDPTREERFVSPRLFTQLLPIVTLRAVETDKPDSNVNPANFIILGETDEAPRLQQWLFDRSSTDGAPKPFSTMLKSLEYHKSKSKIFDMGEGWSGISDPGKTTPIFNCLDRIDETWLPKTLSIWMKDDILIGLKVSYTNGSDLPHGDCTGDASKTIDIKDDKAEFVTQLILEAADPPNSGTKVRSIQLTFDTYTYAEYPALGRPVATHQKPTLTTFSAPTSGSWSFRGFWGCVAPFQGGFPVLGVVWGLDDPKLRKKKISSGSAAGSAGSDGPDYQMFVGRPLPEDAIASANEFSSKSGKYCMSNYLGDNKVIDKENLEYFNDLKRVKDDWKVKSVTFYTGNNGYISGYITNYLNGQYVRCGLCPPSAAGDTGTGKEELWNSVKLDLSKHRDSTYQVINFVDLNDESDKPRGFSGTNAKPVEVTTLSPPDRSWALVGFWGYHHTSLKAFTHLGVVWAKRKELPTA